MRKLRGALIGCGMISEYHLQGWQRIPEVDVVAFCDRKPESANRKRDRFFPAAHVYADLGQLLEEQHSDFVDILTPPAFHIEHCLLAAGAGTHIICQKPLCNDLAAAQSLVAELAGRGQ